jgi:hypothetical protein
MRDTQLHITQEKARFELPVATGGTLSNAYIVVADPTTGEAYFAPQAAVGGGTSGGDTILDFTQEVGKLTITTDQGAFVADLNDPTTTYLSPELLRDPDFDLVLTDYQNNGYSTNAPGWLKTQDWYQNAGTANISVVASPQCFLFQDIFLPATGLYEVKIKANSITGAGVKVLVTAQGVPGTPTMYQGGDYVFYFKGSQGLFRFHLLVDQSVVATATIESCSLRQVQLGAVYGDNYFVHLQGDEIIGGLKTFSTGVDSPVFSLGGIPGLSYNPITSNVITLTVGAPSGVARLTYAGADHEWLLTNSNALGMKLDTGGNLYVQGQVNANRFIGDGSQLTNLPYYLVGNSTDLNIAQGPLGSNTWQGSYTRNRFGNNIYSNTAGNNFYHNTIEDNFIGNNVGVNFQENHIGNYFTFNTIGDNLYFCTFGSYTTRNSIGKDCSYLTFNNYCNYNTIGDNCSFIELYNCVGLNVPAGTTNAVYKNNVQIYPVPAASVAAAPRYAPEFAVSTAGAQTITVPSAGSVVLSVTVLEASGYTRALYAQHFSISGNAVSITVDASLMSGDKLMILYQ